MRTNLPVIFLFFSIICLSPRILAQDEKYDATYLSLVKEYTLNPDGSVDYRYIKQQKLLTYRAFHNLYGETFVTYNPAFQELKINEVFTLMADGKKITAPQNSFNEVLPAFAANAPAYNSMREMVITHTGLERNATITLDYQLHTKKGVFPAMMGNELLAETEPVKSLEIRVRVPAGQDLCFHLFNGDTQPVKSADGLFRVYSWKLNNLPAIAAEEAQAGTNELYPRLIFSTSDRREEVFSFLTSQPAFSFPPDDQITREVNSVVNEKRDKFEIALKIQEKVVNDLRFYPIPLKSALFQCRKPEQTWNSNGGTPVEKAVLLAAMLKSAGIDAQVAGIVRTAFIDEKIATLADIEDFAVKIENKEHGTWYLSVTGLNSVNLKLALPGRSFISLKPGGKASVTRSETPKHMVKVIGNFIVSSDPKLTGEISIYYEGSVYPFAGLQRDKKKMKNSISGGLIGNDTNHQKISTLNNENGFQTYIVQSDKPFRKDSNYCYFSFPVSTSGIESWGIKTLSARRETPYEIPAIADESYSYTIVLPATLGLFTPVKKLAISNKAGTFVWEVRNDEGKVSVKRQLKFSDRVFQVSAYEDFKILMDYWNNPWYRQLIFAAVKS
ncbi:MAG: DUF3857 domain-containing protein [Bacteroidetes bacterium]|nr:DUF3857 domain-containing protein [Bacteroidota bacterium]